MLHLRNIFPADVWELIFAFDSTYHDEMRRVLHGREFKHGFFCIWKKRFFGSYRFVDSAATTERQTVVVPNNNNSIFCVHGANVYDCHCKKLNYLLTSIAEHVFIEYGDIGPPVDIRVYDKSHMIYYANGKSDVNMCRAKIIHEQDTDSYLFYRTRSKICVCLYFADDKYFNFGGYVYTKEEYRDKYMFHDSSEDQDCIEVFFDCNRDFYIIQTSGWHMDFFCTHPIL